ncbi:T9SS type A sorting domain-containing protein [Candidatus Latescibacterota bacterium]
MNTKVFYLTAVIFISQSMVSGAQTNMRRWHESGQTWLVWEGTSPTPETYRIYKDSSEINDISTAEQIGRIFEIEWTAAKLKMIETDSNWTIPDGSGGTYTLANNEALFVYTPHDTASEYFAVVKDGETAVGSNNTTGPISQSTDPVQCHLQSSGSEDGFNYRIYVHWIDGRDDWNSGRSDYPVMGNEHFNGTDHLFRVWEPQGGITSNEIPAVIALHAGGGWFGNMKPGSDQIYDLALSDAFVMCPGDGILIRKPSKIGLQKTYWMGYWEGYDRFSLSADQPVPNEGIVVNYTMRRIDWELGWLLENESIDPLCVSLLGGSMGGRGANFYARAHPERYAAWLSLSPGPGLVADDPLVGSASENVPTNFPGSLSVLDIMDLHTFFSETERDLPFGKIVSGRNDQAGAANWRAEIIQMFEAVNNNGFGTHLYWDERGHIYSSDSHWANSYRLKAKALTSYRRDQSFPAFFDDDQDPDSFGRQPDMGSGDPLDGDTFGTWSGYYSWDKETIIDSPGQWEATVFLISSSSNANDVPPFDSSQTDISIRRPQQFTPSEGNTFEWTLTGLSDAQVKQSGHIIVGENDVVTIQNLIISKDKRRLTVSNIPTSVSSPHDGSGVPTEFAISQNYPNPFNPTTTIEYTLPSNSPVRLVVYSVSGQQVAELVNGVIYAGMHSVTWNAGSMPSGIYFYVLESAGLKETRKMLLMK